MPRTDLERRARSLGAELRGAVVDGQWEELEARDLRLLVDEAREADTDFISVLDACLPVSGQLDCSSRQASP